MPPFITVEYMQREINEEQSNINNIAITLFTEEESLKARQARLKERKKQLSNKISVLTRNPKGYWKDHAN